MPYIQLDAIDLKILSALQDDGRLSNADLAEQVGLSPSPCLRRVRRLERDGFIQGYAARLDRQSVGLSLTVFVELRLDDPSPAAAAALEQALVALPQVVSCHSLAGGADYLAEVVVPGVTAFDALLNGILRNLPHIRDIRSTIALKNLKSGAPLPLGHIVRDGDGEPDCG